jgi:hypothetical protein
VKAEVNNDSDLLIIPGGMTKLLQPLEVANNWPFNVAFRQLYNQWMTTMKHDLTSSSRTKHAPLPTVCEWMLVAWRSISPGVVRFQVLTAASMMFRAVFWVVLIPDDGGSTHL